jgi:trimeric autotransporter adhesin
MKKILILIFIFSSFLGYSQTKKVLFIGNSYTYGHDMPLIVGDLASSTGDNLIIDSSTPSSYSLMEHSTNSVTLGLIHQGGWDYVVLQEYSQWPSQPLAWVEENVYPYVQFLDDEINSYNPGAETVFFMTWGRRDGDPSRCYVLPEVCTYVGMDDLTRERYMYMAQAYHGIVSPVGAVWRYLRENYPSIELFIADGSHPSEAGSYAAACCFYTTILRKDPTLITFNYTLSASDANIIKNAVRTIVYNNLLTWHIGEYDLDTQAPSIPSGLSASAITETSFHLSWTASTDNTGVTGYEVYQNGGLVNTTTGTSLTITGLSASTTYSMTVKAKDAAGNKSAASSPLNVTTSAPVITVLTVTGVTANNKVYNGTVTASLNTGSAALSGVLGGDVVTLVTSGATGTFVNKNAGTAKVVTTSGFTLAGADAGKYTLTQPVTTANITKATLTISGVTANNKVYNGTTAATLSTGSATPVGVFGSDVVNIISSGATGTFANKNVGTSKTVSTTGFTLGGTDGGNYTPTQPSTSANITTAGLTISGVTANNKVYDGTTAATLNTGSAALVGVFGSDVVNLISTGATGTFADANIGTAKVVSTSGFTLGGTDSGNYSLTQPTTTANITGLSLTITGVTANNKVYDGTPAATLNTSSASLSGVLGGDIVTLVSTGATGSFSNKNVGTGKTVSTSGFSLTGADAGKYTLTNPTTTGNITRANLTVSGLSANNRAYDGTTSVTLNTGGTSFVGVFGADIVSLISTGATGTFSNKNVGTGKVVSTSGFALGGTDSGNYSLIQPTTTANITGADLTVSGITADNKAYDGNTSATLNTGGATLIGVVSGDAVTLNVAGAIGTFANANVGTGKVVTISGLTLGGTDSGNYSLIQPTTTANITGLTLTVTGVTANSKVYNGTTTATLNTVGAALIGVLGGDVVNIVSAGASGTFANKNVGNGKVVTTSGFTLGGPDAAKYNLVQPTTTGNITPAILTLSGVTANNKVYDGTTGAILNSGSAVLGGVIGTDAVNLISTGAIGTFVNKNAGTGKSVTTSGFTLGGADAGNYTLTQPTATGNIITASLTVSGVTANNKVYNGTTAATLNTGSAALTGIIGGDIVTLVTTGSVGAFVNKNVGSAKVVTTSGFSIGGTDSGNYTLTQPTTTASITGITLTVTGVTANNKVYNGTTATTLNTGSATLSGVLGGDIVNIVSTGASGTFADKNVGIAKAVSTTGITLGGADAGNYTLIQPTTTANITASLLTVSGVTANNKVYDGTTAATLNTGSATLVGVIGSDIVNLVSTGATGIFANRNVGTGIIVTTSGFTIGGTDSGNYTLTQPTTTANITGLVLAVTGVTANNKVYNGNTATTLNTGSAILSGVIGGDIVTLVSTGATGTFVNKNVGTAKVVSTSGFALAGTDAGKYTLAQPVTTANITTANLTTVGVTANNKVYNGTTATTLNTGSATLAGVFGGDVVNIVSTGATGTFADKNTGIAKVVTAAGITLGGADAGNYNLIQPLTTANITAASLTVSGVTANNKPYDGTTTATLNTGSAALVGVIGADAVNLVSTGARGTFANENVASGKIVTISGFTIGGTDSGNYSVTQPIATANITGVVLSVTGVTANSKVYNGTTATTLNTGSATLSGVMAGDIVTLASSGATGVFVNKNAGIAKTVTTSGFSLTGTDAGNYSLTQPTTVANINTANLTISGVRTNNKVYDGTTTATMNSASAFLTGVYGADLVNLVSTGATGTFVNKNVGIGIPVLTSGYTLGGADAVNYSLSQPSLTGDISPKTLIITASDLIKHYKTTLTFSGTEFTSEGLVAGDVIPNLTIYSTGASASAAVGKYSISISGGVDHNYNYTYVNGVLTVGKSILLAKADTKTRIYGSENPELSIDYSGFVKNEDASVIDILPVISTIADKTSTPGIYPITLSGGTDNNYDIVLVNGSLEIAKAPLTITAEDKTRIYGGINPDLTISYSGFVLGQDKSVLDALPVAETIANSDSGAGIYEINVSGASDSNYSFEYNKGILTINKADQTISFAKIPEGLRMTQEHVLQASSTSGLNVNFEVLNPEVGYLNGNILTIHKEGLLNIKAKQAGDNNWNPAPDVIQSISTLPTFDGISSLFTPNSDGMNDYWYIPELDQYGKLEVTVYNRFGQTVFQSDSYKNDWDGTWKGYPLPSASYYYLIKSSTKGFIKGVVNIVR